MLNETMGVVIKKAILYLSSSVSEVRGKEEPKPRIYRSTIREAVKIFK